VSLCANSCLPSLNRNLSRNRNLQTSKAPLKSQAHGTSLFTSAASNQRGCPKNSPWEAQVRLPEGERRRQISRYGGWSLCGEWGERGWGESVAYLEIGQGGGHMKGIWGTEVLQLGPEAELLWEFWDKAPEAERFLEFKLNFVHVIQ